MTKVEIYTIELLDKKTSKSIKISDEISNNLYSKIFREFPNFILEAPPKDTFNDILKVYASNENSQWKGQSKYNRISGVIVVGRDKDKALSFTNSDKGKTDGGKKPKGKSIDKRHYFEIVFPKNKSTAFLILERTDGRSYKKHIESLLKKFIPKAQPGLKIKLHRFIEKDLILNFLENGKYSKIEFVRKGLSPDKMTRYLGDYEDEGSYTLKTTVIPENKGYFPKLFKENIVKTVENNDTFFSTPELDELGFEKGKTSLRVTSSYNGNERVIDLSNTLRIQPIYNIDLELEEDGFVDFKKMKKEVTKLLDSFDFDIL